MHAQRRRGLLSIIPEMFNLTDRFHVGHRAHDLLISEGTTAVDPEELDFT